MKKQIISMKRGAQKGFTLIELMVVVAIIAILAAFALPMFQDYTKRARVAEGLSMADGLKTQILEYYSSSGKWPTVNSDAGLASAASLSGKAVSSITVAAANNDGVGKIIITYNDKVQQGAKTVTLTAKDTGSSGLTGVMQWTCTGTVDARYLPPECR